MRALLVAVALLILPGFAFAAIAYDTTAHPTAVPIIGVGLTSPSFSTGGTNRVLAVMVTASSNSSAESITAVSCGGVALTRRASSYETPTGRAAEVWVGVAAAQLASVTCAATPSVAADSGNITVLALTGADTTTPVGSVLSNGYAQSTTPSITVPSMQASGSLVVGAFMMGIDDPSVTPDANTTVLQNDNWGYVRSVHVRRTVLAAAGDVGNGLAIGFTYGQLSFFWGAGVEIRAASGGGGPTAGKTNAYRNALVERLFRGTALTFPSTLTARLYSTCPTVSTAGTELVGNGYVAQAVNPGAGTWTLSTTGTTTNASTISFGTATANWTPANCIGLESGGTVYLFGALTGAPVTVVSGETARFGAGTLQISETDGP